MKETHTDTQTNIELKNFISELEKKLPLPDFIFKLFPSFPTHNTHIIMKSSGISRYSTRWRATETEMHFLLFSDPCMLKNTCWIYTGILMFIWTVVGFPCDSMMCRFCRILWYPVPFLKPVCHSCPAQRHWHMKKGSRIGRKERWDAAGYLRDEGRWEKFCPLHSLQMSSLC